MNRPDEEFAARIVRELDHGVEQLDPGTRERLAAARRAALSHYRERPVPAFVPAWVIPGWGRLVPHGARYMVVAATLVLGLAGYAYWQAMPNGSDFSDVDIKLLTDDLPIDAYLDTGFDSWLKRAPR